MTSASKLLPLVLVGFTCLTYLLSHAVFTSLAQADTENSSKRVTHSSWKNEPIKIVEVKNHLNGFRLNSYVEQGGDWLDGLSIRIRNKSVKKIRYLEASLDFPETQRSGNMMVFPLTFGKNPADKRHEVPQEFVESNKDLDLILDPKSHKRLKAFLETRQKIEELSELQIRVIKILYDDDTGWNLGNFVRMEPGNPIPVIVPRPKDNGEH